MIKFEYWPVLSKSPAFARFKSNIIAIDSISKSNVRFGNFFLNEPLFLSAHVSGANDFDFLFLKSMNSKTEESVLAEIFLEIAGSNKTIEERSYDGNTIKEITLIDKSTFSFSVSKGILIASFTPFLVEDALRQLKLGKPVFTDFEAAKTSFKSTGMDLYLNFNYLPPFLNIFLESTGSKGIASLRRFSNWSCSGIQINGNTLVTNGYIKQTDSLRLVNCFSGQQPVPMNLIKILPDKTTIIQYFGLSDFNLFYSKIQKNYADAGQLNRKQKLIRSITEQHKLKVEDKLLEWMGNEYAMVILEPTGLNFENNSFAIFKTKKIGDAKNSLKTMSRIVDKKLNIKTKEETYNGHSIGFVGLTGVLPALFGESFNKVNKMYYTDIGNYIVFGNQASSLRMFIDEFDSGALLSKSEHFSPIQKQIGVGGNFLFYASPTSSTYILKSVLNSTWRSNLDTYKELFGGFNDFSFILKASTTKFEIQGMLNFSKTMKREGVSQAFTIETDSSVMMRPLLTKDPVSQTKQLIFQDDSEAIFFSDNDGDILWKLSIDGKVMSDFFEIDLFKNSSRQFLFNTKDYLYLIDAEGKPVGNYPIRLPAPATNGISVIDFEKKKDPRIYLACENKRVYAYLPSGKPLPGWNFQKLTGTITDPIRTVRLSGKDFLVINDREGGISIVNKFGEAGVTLIQEFIVAKNSEFFADPSGSFVTTDSNGNVVIVSADGLVQVIPLNAAGPDHGFVYQDVDDDGEPDYVFLDGKELTAYNKGLALIFRKVFESSMTGQLQLLTLKDQKKAFGVKSVAANKCWLIKLDGSIYQGFPVKGCGTMVIEEINTGGKYSLLVGSLENNFTVFTLD
ncbi:MAG: DUF3352 domain-containing protein [Bacteroidetes bacterium]|nr:DUF3352 domain-containing protein [Bacteroidota bacterium]